MDTLKILALTQAKITKDRLPKDTPKKAQELDRCMRVPFIRKN